MSFIAFSYCEGLINSDDGWNFSMGDIDSQKLQIESYTVKNKKTRTTLCKEVETTTLDESKLSWCYDLIKSDLPRVSYWDMKTCVFPSSLSWLWVKTDIVYYGLERCIATTTRHQLYSVGYYNLITWMSMRERGAYLQTVHRTYRERGCNKARDVKRKRGRNWGREEERRKLRFFL